MVRYFQASQVDGKPIVSFSVATAQNRHAGHVIEEPTIANTPTDLDLRELKLWKSTYRFSKVAFETWRTPWRPLLLCFWPIHMPLHYNYNNLKLIQVGITFPSMRPAT